MKNFINIKDIPVRDLKKILLDAKKRKAKRKKLNYLEPDKDIPLKGRFLIQMFEKSSTRTRLSFYLAIRQLGGGALNLRKDELHFGEGGESIHDTAKILSNYGDIFMFRTDSDKKLQEFKKYIKIPIINGLSPSSHPTQILSDIFTIEEIKKQSIHNLNICWIGDSTNVLNSLIEASVKFSFNLKIGSPKKYEPSQHLTNWAKKNKGKIQIFNDPKKAVLNSDVIFADKFIGLYDKKNNPWAIIELNGEVGRADIFVFNNVYDKHKNLIQDDACIFITGSPSRRDDDGDSLKMIAKEILPLSNIRQKLSHQVNIFLSHKQNDTMLILKIKELADRYNLLVIEDAAEAFMSKKGNKYAYVQFSDFTGNFEAIIFSLKETKITS